MELSEDLQKKLARKFEPASMVEMKFKDYDILFKTDEEGNAILLFVGKKTELGTIKVSDRPEL